MTVRALVLARPGRSLLAGSGVLAVLAAVAFAPKHARPAEVPVLAIEARESSAVVREVAPEVEAPEAVDPVNPLDTIQPMDATVDPADFAFVAQAGGTTYIELASHGDAAVAADRTNADLFNDGTFAAAIVPLSADVLSESLRPWKGRRVLVNGTCAATVVGFAEVTQASGDVRFVLPIEGRPDDPTWTLETVFASGRTMIAGELEGDCTGTWARAADRPAVGRAIAVEDPRLERAAKRAFLTSRADTIAHGWREAEQEGNWRDHVPLTARIVKHSITGARWAFVHARKRGGCGFHDVNVPATYQVSDDGVLTEVETGGVDGNEIVDLLDLNGDGWFERIVSGHADSNLSLVGPASSSTLASITVPYLGCGC